MREGEEELPPDDVRQANAAELAVLSARITELEHQVADLRNLLTSEKAGWRGLRPRSDSRQLDSQQLQKVTSVQEADRSAQAPTFANVSPALTTGSLENRLGSQIFSRVGIVALLIGATWFLKLAIDNQWIGPTGRVLAGLIAGAALVLWSERFRRQGFSTFSYSLKAVGSGVLYLSLWAAFQIYHLLPSAAALIAMLLVTAWNAYMAWVQNAQVLGAYALIGGCATPLLLSTGGNHEIFLFIYLLAIDIATVVLVRLRSWPRLLFGVFPATVAYFAGWYSEFYSAEQLIATGIFITLFFGVFASVPLRMFGHSGGEAAGQESRPESVITSILLPLANAVFASLAFYAVLQDAGHHDELPWMVLIFAAIYLGIMRLPQSAVAAAIHLSLAIVFLTIAIPLKASGRWITVSWLVEGTALIWVSAQLASAGATRNESHLDAHRVIRILAIGALLLGLGGLLLRMYWFDFAVAPAFVNRRFTTALVGIAAFSLTAWISLHAHYDADSNQSKLSASSLAAKEEQFWLQIAGGSIIAINLIAVLAIVREITVMLPRKTANPEADLQQALAISAFLMIYGAGLLAMGFWKHSAFIRWQALLLIVYTIAKTFLYDMRNLSQGYRVVSFMALGALLLAVSFAYQNDWLALRDTQHAEPHAAEDK